MPKVKTNSGAKKRFRFTGTGKIKRHHAYHSHILTKKTKKPKSPTKKLTKKLIKQPVKKSSALVNRKNFKNSLNPFLKMSSESRILMKK